MNSCSRTRDVWSPGRAASGLEESDELSQLGRCQFPHIGGHDGTPTQDARHQLWMVEATRDVRQIRTPAASFTGHGMAVLTSLGIEKGGACHNVWITTGDRLMP